MRTPGFFLISLGLAVWGGTGPRVQGAVLHAVQGPVHVDTGYIWTPPLVSSGMAQIQASVPAQAGATYRWTVANGTIPGVASNAAVYFNAPAAGTVTLTCVVTLGGVASTYSQAVPVVPVVPPVTSPYGSGFSADSLANTVVGGPSANQVSYRFQARYAAALTSIRIFFIWSTTKIGYNAGLGGTIRVDLVADDGTAAHVPQGPALASSGAILPTGDFYPRIVFPSPAVLKGGGIYHLVFTNIDPDPVHNFVSLDSLYTQNQTAPMQPVIPDAAFAVLFRPGNGAWRLRQGYTPTLELDFQGGIQGNGYMEVWSANPKNISGPAAVRETFKVSGPSRLFRKVLVRVERLTGSGPLTVRVEEGDGTLVDQVEAQSVVQGVSHWVTAVFPLTHVLNSGVTYHLTLTSAPDTLYTAFPLRKGLDKGFAPATVFPDGFAQFTTGDGTAWKGWDMWGTPNLTFSDLQFSFVP